jgi:hypothetical protein
MRHTTSQQLYAYWNDVRGSRLAPRRFEIEPSRIAPLLPETFILEGTEEGAYRFRLAGTRLCETFGGELRGSDFLDCWDAEDRKTVGRLLASIAQQGGVMRIEMLAGTGDPRRLVPFELLVLPLVHLQATADRFIGCWCALEQPAWLGGQPLVERSIIEADIIWPDGRPHDVVERQDRQAPFLPHVRNSRLVRIDRRQFRVYDGGLCDAPERGPGEV